ncbi:MAG TPA: glycine cleavage system protein GcvH [Polyangia bacterium]|jgi:glycine cleavage system H protein|nr:glycine cleavage system protein GcvH [Polyangia bacterium]
MTNESTPDDLLYTKDHEWARLEDKDGQTTATIGITRFAVDHLGDVTQLELPKPGDSLRQGQIFGSVESVKAVSDLFAPLSGTVVKVNGMLYAAPEHVNTSPYRDGWMVQIVVARFAEKEILMDPASYRTFLHEQAE